MNEKEFKKLVKKDKYQVFLFSCPAPIPTNIGLHHWFVVNNKGKLSRWEVLMTPSQCKSSWKYLHKSTKFLSEGMNKYHLIMMPRTQSKLLHFIEGKKRSLAEKMAKFISNSPVNYPFCNKYFMFGPNSNTFIQWIIDKFSKSGFKLSWRAIGKDYKVED